jgi:predicted nucleotidyltransferase
VLDSVVIERCRTIAKQFGVNRLVLFGSALESPTPRDIDLACEGVQGWDLFRLGAALEEALSRPVDLVPLRDDRFSRYVASRGQVIYESQ